VVDDGFWSQANLIQALVDGGIGEAPEIERSRMNIADEMNVAVQDTAWPQCAADFTQRTAIILHMLQSIETCHSIKALGGERHGSNVSLD